MLLRGNPACHRRRDDFVLQDAPVPKRNGCNALYGQDRVVNLVGQFVPTREPSFLDSSGKDNPPPRNPRTENSLSVSPPPPTHSSPLSPRRDSRSSSCIQELFLLAPIGPARASSLLEKLLSFASPRILTVLGCRKRGR